MSSASERHVPTLAPSCTDPRCRHAAALHAFGRRKGVTVRTYCSATTCVCPLYTDLDQSAPQNATTDASADALYPRGGTP